MTRTHQQMSTIGPSALIIFLSIASVACQNKYDGSPCAFADLNYDRFTDIIAITQPNTLVGYLQSSETLLRDAIDFKTESVYTIQLDGVVSIQSCATGDFDGDSYMDVVVVFAPSRGASELGARVCFGTEKGKFNCTLQDDRLMGLKNDVTVFDYNFDGRSDLLLQFEHSLKVVTFSTGSGNYINYPFINLDKQASIRSDALPPVDAGDYFMHAYVDLVPLKNSPTKTQSDLMAELIIGAKNESMFVLQQLGDEGWRISFNMSPKSALSSERDAATTNQPLNSNSMKFVSHMTLGDFDADGHYDILIAGCMSDGCEKDEFLTLSVWSNNADREPDDVRNWHWLPQLHLNGYRVVIDPPKLGGRFQLRQGDYTLDGFPDLLLTLHTNGDEKNTTAVLIKNLPYSCKDDSCYSRTFEVVWSPTFLQPAAAAQITKSTFFDVFEDGLLDVMLEYKPVNTDSGNAQFMFLIAEALSDATFLKAQVYTPSCLDCSLQREGSIISMPGATLAYQSTDSDGSPIQGIHTQYAQTGTRALCLPFALFGLGRSPNFVQSLKVGVPAVVNAAEGTVPKAATYTWEQIVPNSRMYIIPPTKDNNGWIGRLYLTPGRLVLMSVATMTALLAIVLTIILGLWWRERQMDNYERQQQSQRFDFNAM